MRGRLTRSTTDRKIAGVAAGVAAYFDLDPTLVRLVWLLSVLVAGSGIFLYVLLWVILPEESATADAEGAIAIAEERYARGEITSDDLARIRADLEAG